jgi:hypothetical protein
MQALVGQQAPFEHGREQLKVLAGLEVTSKSVERSAEAIGADIAQQEQQQIQTAVQLDRPIPVGQPIPILYVQMDGTGVPVVKKETLGRQGKIAGQPAHTREVKLGCAFTQSTWDKEGYAIRDPDSSTYSGAIETAEEFGKRIYREALKRGWRCAKKKVVIGDGAEWIWTLVAEHFPEAMQIVDLYHARQHLWEVARQLYPHEKNKQNAWMQVHQKSAGPGKNRKIGGRAAGHAHQQCRSGREDSPGGRLQSGLLRDEEGSCVITHLKRRVRVYDSTFQITETRAKRRASRRPKMSVRSGGAKLVRIALSEGVSGSQTNGP